MKHSGKATRTLLCAGLCAGLALITKVEFGVICYLTWTAGILLQVVGRRSFKDWKVQSLALIPGVVVVACVFGWFAWKIPAALLYENIHTRRFYLDWAGRRGFRFDATEVLAFALLGFMAVAVWGFVALTLAYVLRSRQHGLTPVAGIGGLASIMSEAEVFPKVISFVRWASSQGKDVLMLPEETSLYFLSGVAAPSRFYALTPGVLYSTDQEERYIAELESKTVDYVLISNRNT
jgi:hypothetical protein